MAGTRTQFELSEAQRYWRNICKRREFDNPYAALAAAMAVYVKECATVNVKINEQLDALAAHSLALKS